MLTYTYPASRMPLVTMASAWARMVASSICLLKWFQLFHPMGGVVASFTDCWPDTVSHADATKMASAPLRCMGVLHSRFFCAPGLLSITSRLLIAKLPRYRLRRFLHNGRERRNFFFGNPGQRTAHAQAPNHFPAGIEDRRGNAARSQNCFFVVQGVAQRARLRQVLLELAGLGERAWRHALKRERWKQLRNLRLGQVREHGFAQRGAVQGTPRADL